MIGTLVDAAERRIALPALMLADEPRAALADRGADATASARPAPRRGRSRTRRAGRSRASGRACARADRSRGRGASEARTASQTSSQAARALDALQHQFEIERELQLADRRRAAARRRAARRDRSRRPRLSPEALRLQEALHRRVERGFGCRFFRLGHAAKPRGRATCEFAKGRSARRLSNPLQRRRVRSYAPASNRDERGNPWRPANPSPFPCCSR